MSNPEDNDLPDNVIRIDFRARRVRTLEESPEPVAPKADDAAMKADAPPALVPTPTDDAPAPKPRRSRASATKADDAPVPKPRRSRANATKADASTPKTTTERTPKTRPARTSARTEVPAKQESAPLPNNVTRFPVESAAPTAPAVEVSVRVELDPSEVDSYNERRHEYFDRVIREGMVAVTFDPRRAGVSVPPAFAGRPELMLNFSLRFNIADFAWDSEGVRASLSFDDGPYFCEIPWSAVWLMVSKPTYSAYAVPFDAPPERRGTIPGMLRSVRAMLEQLPPPR